MTKDRITYSASPSTTPESELNALNTVYRFILDSHAKKRAAPTSRPKDARKDLSDGAIDFSIQRR